MWLRDYIRRIDVALGREIAQLGRVQEQALEREITALRNQVEDVAKQRITFVSLDSYEARHQQLEQRLGNLERWQANLAGRAVGFAVIGSLILAATTAIITHLLS
jgi:hypothetical protein